VLLDHEPEVLEADVEVPAVDRDQQSTGIQRSGLPTVAIEQVLSIRSRERAQEIPQVLRQGQLGQADLVVDAQPSGFDLDLDRSVDTLVWDVVGSSRERGEEDANPRDKGQGPSPRGTIRFDRIPGPGRALGQ
jgi:hypothetical protein